MCHGIHSREEGKGKTLGQYISWGLDAWGLWDFDVKTLELEWEKQGCSFQPKTETAEKASGSWRRWRLPPCPLTLPLELDHASDPGSWGQDVGSVFLKVCSANSMLPHYSGEGVLKM